MHISQVIAELVSIMAKEGNIKVFSGDMQPINQGHFDVVEAQATDNVVEAQLYGKRYLHLGEW
jgi:hypothetical protein